MSQRTLFSDDFSRADGALGSNYSYDWSHGMTSDQLVIMSGAVGSYSNSTEFAYSMLDAPADVWVQITFNPPAGSVQGAMNSIALFARDSESDYGYVAMYQEGSGYWWIYGTTGTLYTMPIALANGTSVPLSPGDVLRFEVQGTSLRFYKNGVLLGEATDSTYAAAGFVGFGANRWYDFDSGNAVSVVDNFSFGDWGGDDGDGGNTGHPHGRAFQVLNMRLALEPNKDGGEGSSLGVDLTLQQTDADIYSWSQSQESVQVQGLARLPSSTPVPTIPISERLSDGAGSLTYADGDIITVVINT